MTETITPSSGISLPGLENIQAKFKTAGQTLRGGDKSDNEALRRELIKVNVQFQQTAKIIQGDREALTELAKSDERIAKLLALADDNKSQIISNKILDRAHVTQQEAALLIFNLKDTTNILTELNRTFEVSVGDVVRNFGSLVSDSRIDTESRRKMAQDISQFAQESLDKEQTRLEAMDEIPLKQLEQLEKQQAALNDLNKIMADSPSSAEFEKNSDAISKLVTRLGDQTVAIKTLTTLDNLNNTMDSAVLTQEELKETLEKQVGDGKSFEEMFKENPDMFSQEGVGGGLISQLLGGLGLGGLEGLIAPTLGRMLGRGVGGISGAFGRTRLGGLAARGIGGARALPGRVGGAAARLGTGGLQMAGRGIGGAARAGIGAVGGLARGAGGLAAGGLALGGRAAGGAAKGIGGLLKGGASFLGKAAGFAKFLGPLGAVIAVGKGIFDAVDGFNRAAEIAGLKEGEEATFGQKIQAAASSTLSGLTFGLLDEKTIFQGIESIKGSITEGVEFLGEKARAIWDSVASTFTADNIKSVASSVLSGLTFGLLSPETISSGIDKVASTLSDGISAVGDFAMKAWEDPIGTLTGALTSVKDFAMSGGFVGLGLRGLDSIFGTDINGWFSEKTKFITDGISSAMSSVGDAAMRAWEDPVGTLTGALSGVADFVLGGGFIGAGVRGIDAVFGTDIGGWFSEKLGAVGKSVSGVFTSIGSFLTDSMADVARFFDPEAIFKSVTEWGSGLAKSIKDKIGGLLSFLPGFGEKVRGDLGDISGAALGVADAGAPAALVKAGRPVQSQVAKITTPEPARMADVPTAEEASVAASTMKDIRGFLAKLAERRDRDPVPVNISAVADKPPLDRRTDIGDGMLGMLSTILDG